MPAKNVVDEGLCVFFSKLLIDYLIVKLVHFHATSDGLQITLRKLADITFIKNNKNCHITIFLSLFFKICY